MPRLRRRRRRRVVEPGILVGGLRADHGRVRWGQDGDVPDPPIRRGLPRQDGHQLDVNEARIEVRSEKLGKSKRARLVDLPGHPRLRAKLDRYANGAKAIIFVVDAVDFTSQRRAVAEHLFEILSHPVVQKRRCPIMIACNKSEKITAHPADFVRKRLEKEIEALRTTRGTLEDTGGGESVTGSVGLDGAEFAFEHQRSNKVEAAGCAVAGNDLESVREFIVRRG